LFKLVNSNSKSKAISDAYCFIFSNSLCKDINLSYPKLFLIRYSSHSSTEFNNFLFVFSSVSLRCVLSFFMSVILSVKFFYSLSNNSNLPFKSIWFCFNPWFVIFSASFALISLSSLVSIVSMCLRASSLFLSHNINSLSNNFFSYDKISFSFFNSRLIWYISSLVLFKFCVFLYLISIISVFFKF